MYLFLLFHLVIQFTLPPIPQLFMPARLSDSGNVCELLQFEPRLWGWSITGEPLSMDTTSIRLNRNRQVLCDYRISDFDNSIQLILHQVFADASPEKNSLMYSERYRKYTRKGNILAYVYVSKEGHYAGHKIEEELSVPFFKAIETEFPFYKLNFQPALRDGEPTSDTLKVWLKIEQKEEIFVAERP